MRKLATQFVRLVLDYNEIIPPTTDGSQTNDLLRSNARKHDIIGECNVNQ